LIDGVTWSYLRWHDPEVRVRLECLCELKILLVVVSVGFCVMISFDMRDKRH